MKQRFKTLDEYINESKQLSDLDNIVNNLDMKKINRLKIEADLLNELRRQAKKLGYDLTHAELMDLREVVAKMRTNENVNEASITADIVPGAFVNIMDMKGVVTEITQEWNGTVYGFNFKNDIGEDHSAMFIGDKFILREGEEVPEELLEKKIDIGDTSMDLRGSQIGYVGAVVINAIEKEIGHTPDVYEFSKLIKNVVADGKAITTKEAAILIGDYEGCLDAYRQGVHESKVNEGAEELKAYDAIKTGMFKIQKILKPILDSAKELDIIKNFKIDIKPYNGGLELKNNITMSWNRKMIETHEDIANNLSNFYGLHLQPSSFFQSDLEEGKSYLDGQTFKFGTDEGKYKKYPVETKADIKKAVDEYTKETIAELEKLNNALRG